MLDIAKDCLLTGQEQACTRITRLFVCHHAENGSIHRTMVVDCPLVITSKVKLIFRPDKTRKKEWMVQPVFCIVDAGSCYFIWSANELITHHSVGTFRFSRCLIDFALVIGDFFTCLLSTWSHVSLGNSWRWRPVSRSYWGFFYEHWFYLLISIVDTNIERSQAIWHWWLHQTFSQELADQLMDGPPGVRGPGKFFQRHAH